MRGKINSNEHFAAQLIKFQVTHDSLTLVLSGAFWRLSWVCNRVESGVLTGLLFSGKGLAEGEWELGLVGAVAHLGAYLGRHNRFIQLQRYSVLLGVIFFITEKWGLNEDDSVLIAGS